MPDPIPPTDRFVEPTPKRMNLQPQVKNDLMQWLNGQQENIKRYVDRKKQEIDVEAAKRNDPPRNFLQKWARKLEGDSTVEMRRGLLSEQRHLCMIKDAQLDLNSGRVDRVELLLIVDLTQIQQYLSMSKSAEDPYFKFINYELQRSFDLTELLKHINPERAQEFSKWFSGFSL